MQCELLVILQLVELDLIAVENLLSNEQVFIGRCPFCQKINTHKRDGAVFNKY